MIGGSRPLHHPVDPHLALGTAVPALAGEAAERVPLAIAVIFHALHERGMLLVKLILLDDRDGLVLDVHVCSPFVDKIFLAHLLTPVKSYIGCGLRHPSHQREEYRQCISAPVPTTSTITPAVASRRPMKS